MTFERFFHFPSFLFHNKCKNYIHLSDVKAFHHLTFCECKNNCITCELRNIINKHKFIYLIIIFHLPFPLLLNQ